MIYNLLFAISISQIVVLLGAIILNFDRRPAALAFFGAFLSNMAIIAYCLQLYLEFGLPALVNLRGITPLFFWLLALSSTAT